MGCGDPPGEVGIGAKGGNDFSQSEKDHGNVIHGYYALYEDVHGQCSAYQKLAGEKLCSVAHFVKMGVPIITIKPFKLVIRPKYTAPFPPCSAESEN